MLIDIINIVNIASVYKTAIIFQEIDGNNRLSLLVIRQILLVRNHRQDFLHAKKRNPGYD